MPHSALAECSHAPVCELQSPRTGTTQQQRPSFGPLYGCWRVFLGARVIGIYPLAWLQPAVSSQCKCRRVTGTWRLLWMPCLALSAWLRRQPASCPASGGYGHSRIMHGCHASPCWTKRESPTCCLFSTRSRCAVLPRWHAKFGGRLCPKSRRPSRIRRSETMGI